MPGPWRLGCGDYDCTLWVVSISTEMPGPWRRDGVTCVQFADESFNLNRDARPLATPMAVRSTMSDMMFQSQPRCQAPGDVAGTTLDALSRIPFQSQPRCQAPGAQ